MAMRMTWQWGLAGLLATGVFVSCGRGDSKIDPQEFAKDWKATKAFNFTVYTPSDTPRPKRGVDAFAISCDQTYDYVAGQLKVQVEGDIGVYLFTSDEDCKAATGRPASFVEGLNIYTRLGAPMGGLIAEAICNSVDPEAKSFKLIRDGVRNLFDERDQNVHYEALVLRGQTNWPTLENLIERQTDENPAVYKFASASFTAFLIQRYGIDQFWMLWRSVLDLRQSIEKIYGGTLPQMEEEWLRIQDKMAKRT